MNSQPDPPLYFLVAGDLHAGTIPAERLAAVFHAAARAPAAFLAVPGDLANDGLPEQYALVAEQVARLPFPFYPVMGNHDTHNGPDDESRARFCEVFSLEDVSYRREIAGAPFLFLSTDGFGDGGTVEIERSLPLLEKTLEDGEGLLVVFCHAPLTGTVDRAPGRPSFSSNDPMFGLPSSDRVRELVRRAGRPVVWISGHTHSPLETENLIHTERLGDAVLHGFNASSPYFTGRDLMFDAPMLLYHCRLDPAALHIRIEDISTGQTLREERLGGEGE